MRSAGPRIAAYLPQAHEEESQGLCGSPHPAELLRLVFRACAVALCCVFRPNYQCRDSSSDLAAWPSESVDSRSSALAAGAKAFPQIETQKHRKRQVVLDDSR